MNKQALSCVLLLSFFVLSGSAQSIDSLYRFADNYHKNFTSKYYHGISDARAVGEDGKFVYQTRTNNGSEYYLIDAGKKLQGPAFDHARLADSLSVVLNRKTSAYQLPLRQFRLSSQADSIHFNVGEDEFHADLTNYRVVAVKSQRQRGQRYWGGVFKEDSKEAVSSPDGKMEAYISEGNLWKRDKATGKKQQLSNDGSPYGYYSSNIYWSPDSRKIVCCRYYPVETRKLLLISSSPKNQLQPVTEQYDYPKPGDALPVRRPVAFDVENGGIIKFDVPDIEQQYDLSNFRWSKNSDYFTFEFNKRGHQQYFVYSGDIAAKTLKAIIKEESDTFVYYNSLYRYWFENGNEVLWISERDGWRHLYLYDSSLGKVKKQLTKGDWIVKSVVRVDEKKGTVLFVGCGMDKNEDPYLEKYYMLDIGSGKVTPLTPENGNHVVTFSSDHKYMLDVYSRVDMPPVVLVRSVEENGKVIYKPDNQPDASKLMEEKWSIPEVFSAKGRDGKTDIWGVIIRPSNFDPSRKYPVIEYIYAGPHDSHVPKSFAVEHHCSALSELGFILVMIDGMGTSNRSKAFHDVCWQNLKDAGFPDRIAWIKAAAEKHPEMNIERMGIYGVSAGAQSSMGALLFHPEFYKVGVSSCGCHDNRMDKIWWNEQWMGYPVGKHYEESSNVANAHLLQGKLMLILGELDNNVDPSSTLQVVDKLIEHDKEFDFVMLPGARHTMGEKYGERKRRDFFMRHILKLETPDWNI